MKPPADAAPIGGVRHAAGRALGLWRSRVSEPALDAVDAALWTSNQRLGLSLIVASCLVTLVIAALGPSAVALQLGPAPGLLPPWSIPEGLGKTIGLPLSEWVVVPALWVGIVAGAVGLWICWRAVAAGWRPSVHRLFTLGAALSLATALVPPLTSADVLMYAAYGRLQRQGINPYDITPAEIFRQSFDPVLIFTEQPWQDTPSVYGPLASLSQWAANMLGGDSMHDVVFWLQLFSVLPLIVIGAVLVKLAHGDPERQARAVLFTILNPLLIWAVVAGAHNEALTLVFAICALGTVRKNAFVTGIFIGLAGCFKVSLVYYGLALAWAYRRDWRKLVALGLGALIPLVVGYGVFAPQALFAAGRNVGYISQGSWGPPVVYALDFVLSDGVSRQIVTSFGWVLMVVVGWMLSRVLPWDPVPGARVPARADPLTIAARTALVLCAAWLVTSPYSLAWYDLLAWAPLAILAPNKLDKALIWRGAALSVAYVSARALQFGPAMQSASWLVREVLCSAIQIGVLGYVFWWWWTSGRELPTRRFVARGFRRIFRPTHV